MKILALDGSAMAASAALMEDDRLIAHYLIDHRKTHSQTLLPMVKEILEMTETEPSALDAIALTGGPGSFTGLRIVSATAKGMGLVLDIPLVEVPTLKAMAWNFWGFDGIVCPMMDARRDQVFTASYRFDGSDMREETAPFAGLVKEMAESLAGSAGRIMLLGDGADAHREYLAGALGARALFAPPSQSRCSAASAASCAMLMLREGKTVSADAHRPEYLRVSQAERVRAEKLKARAAAGDKDHD